MKLQIPPSEKHLAIHLRPAFLTCSVTRLWWDLLQRSANRRYFRSFPFLIKNCGEQRYSSSAGLAVCWTVIYGNQFPPFGYAFASARSIGISHDLAEMAQEIFGLHLCWECLFYEAVHCESQAASCRADGGIDRYNCQDQHQFIGQWLASRSARSLVLPLAWSFQGS